MQTSALLTLRAGVVSASNPATKGEALAELGSYLAQLGEFAEAEGIRDDLKASFSAGNYPRVSIRIMILEALIAYYSGKSDASLDRVRRARAVAEACAHEDLVAEAAVWVAHLAFNFEQYAEFKDALDLVLGRFARLQNQLRARVCLSVADVNNYLGQQETAGEWYKFARIFSRRARDHVLIAAIEYNRLSMGLARYRADRALGVPIDGAHKNWYMELTSVQALAENFGGKALPELLEMCNLLTCQLKGDYAGAVDSLDRLILAQATAVCGMSEELAELERMWCSMNADGQLLEDYADVASIARVETFSLNDQLIALPFLEAISSRLGIELDRARYSALQCRAVKYYEDTTSEMRSGIGASLSCFELVRHLAMNPE